MACTHAKGLYSCESSQVDEHALRKYTSALLKLFGTDNQMHSRSLTFGFSGLRCSIDLFVAIFQRRVTMLRRFLAKNPAKCTLFVRIYDAYAQKSYVGSFLSTTDVSQLTPAPLPGDNGRSASKATETLSGPIGLLLQHTHICWGVLST